jgi:hypothetical protein
MRGHLLSGHLLSRLVKLSFILLLGFASAPVWGQAMGSITGTVVDPSGAAIVGAKVTVTRTDAGVSQSSETNGVGRFAFPSLVVGTYGITVTAAGFNAKTTDGITLDVSQQRDLTFTMSVLGSTQTAEVTAAVPLMTTTSGQIAGLVTQEQIVDMPLNGRSIQNLVTLQPGMAADQGQMGWMAPQWSSNGNRGETEVSQLDGADATDVEFGTIQFWNLNLDAIAEFKVLQANYSAEFGEGGGTITQIVTKSGSNQLHGSAYEFLRNNALDARNYFSTSVPPLHRNEFGVNFGGPILKNKLFFDGEYAGLQETQGEPTVVPVPTESERTGLVAIGGYHYQVPLNPTAATVLKAYPSPNQPDGLYGANTLNFSFSQPSTMNQYSIRIDATLSPRDSLFGRASYINNSQNYTDPVAAIENLQYSANVVNDPRNFAIGETHIFSPRLINVGLIALDRQLESDEPPTIATTQTTFSDNSYAEYGPDPFVTHYEENYLEPSDRVMWNVGRHNFTLGVQYRYVQDNAAGSGNGGPAGFYTFSPGTPLTATLTSTDGGPDIPAGTGSPSGAVSMMEGDDAIYNRTTPMVGYGAEGAVVSWGLRRWNIATYIQDDININDKLTLNVGLRYEYQSVPYEIRNRLGGLIDEGPLAGHIVLNPSPVYQPDRLNFAPRLGFAYRLTPKTVLRGGYAIFTNLIPTCYPDQEGFHFPLSTNGFLAQAPYSLTPQSVPLPQLTSTNGTPMPPNGNPALVPKNTPINLLPITAVIGLYSGSAPSPEMKNGYTTNANLTLEQQLPSNVVFKLTGITTDSTNQYNARYPNGYVGGLPQNSPWSTISPGMSEVKMFYSQGLLHYLALQADLRKTSNRLQYQANFTWAQDLTDSDTVFSANSPNNSGETMNDPTCLTCEYARANNLVAKRFIANATYDAPTLWRPVPDVIGRGWEIAGIFNIQSGSPFTIVSPYGTQQFGYDNYNGSGARPFFLQTAPRNSDHGNPQFFTSDVVNNPQKYWSVPTTTNAALGTVQTAPGNLGRNTYTSPSWWNLDFSLVKNTTIVREAKLQLRAEFFNIFNHTTLSIPSGSLDTSSFGLTTSTAYSERQIQFGARILF